MRSTIFAFVALAAFALTACADVPDDSEEQSDTESELAAKKVYRKPVKPPTTPTIPDAQRKNPTPAPPRNTNTTPSTSGGSNVNVLVTWNGVTGHEASLDVILDGDQVIGPCIAVDILRDEFNRGASNGLGYGFDGNCKSANRRVSKNDISGFQICTTANNDWANARCTRANWDGNSSTVHIDNR